jgi:hypothetical protein
VFDEEGLVSMSHLSILPTVLRDVDCLAASLTSMGFEPRWGGVLKGFAGESEPVQLQVKLGSHGVLGWAPAADGSLALVGDLQRISRSRTLQRLLSELTRHYASRLALLEAQASFDGASVTLVP